MQYVYIEYIYENKTKIMIAQKKIRETKLIIIFILSIYHQNFMIRKLLYFASFFFLSFFFLFFWVYFNIYYDYMCVLEKRRTKINAENTATTTKKFKKK